MKKYKAFSPEVTISNIRKSLNDLGVLLYENHIVHEDFFSCRVCLGNNNLLPLNIGTNGKGRSFEYSLASGYAEFMERLQNQLLLNSKKMLSSKTFNLYSISSNEAQGNKQCSYSTDEQYVSSQEIDSSVLEELSVMSGMQSANEFKNALNSFKKEYASLCVPFYDVQNDSEKLFPIEILLLLTGSNGMASGNTPKEAILQSICEIFERYVISEIYWRELTPPTIPFSALPEGKTKEVLKKYIENTGNQVIVKDCSLGLGIPAIGLLILDTKTYKYNLKIGVDFVPEIALERCFTEIHQGRDVFGGLPYTFIHTKDTNGDARKKAEENLMNIFIDGTGFWPISILKEQSSYAFNGFNLNYGNSNSEDIRYAIHLIHRLGYNVYIRDNSILGFPTYYVVVPGMSQIIAKNPFESVYKNSFVNLAKINQLGNATIEIAQSILHAIEENYTTMKSNSFMLKNVFVHNTNPDLNELQIEMLGALLAIYVEDPPTAIKYLELYLEDKNKNDYRYYYACLEYLKTTKTDNSILKLLYGESLANEVTGDLQDHSKVLQHYHFPSCPNCKSCKLAGECMQKVIEGISDKVKQNGHELSQTQIGIDLWNKSDR